MSHFAAPYSINAAMKSGTGEERFWGRSSPTAVGERLQIILLSRLFTMWRKPLAKKVN